jgi:hypothetical protein
LPHAGPEPRLKTELNIRLVAEVALVVVALREVVAKSGQQILNWAGRIARYCPIGIGGGIDIRKSNELLLGDLLATEQPDELQLL